MERNHNGIIWTAEMIDEFTKLLEEYRNGSYVKIAGLMTEKFGVTFTKNSCIGKGRRLRISPRPVRLKKVDAPIPPVMPRRRTGSLTIVELREGNCRWPMCELEDRPPYLYCGMPAPVGSSWCKQHAKRVYSKSTSYGNASLSHPSW